jgi:hypothetical protein
MKPEEGSSAMKIPPQVLPVRAQSATAGVTDATGSGASPPRHGTRIVANTKSALGKTRRKRMSWIDCLLISFVEPPFLFVQTLYTR